MNLSHPADSTRFVRNVHADSRKTSSIGSPRVFLINGTVANWYQARRLESWGLPSHRVPWREARAQLQDIGFGSASVFVAVAGPLALFSGVIDGDPFFDDTPTFGCSSSREPYAVRFKFTQVFDEVGPWFDEIYGLPWRAAVDDLYFQRKSLYSLKPSARTWDCVQRLFEKQPFRSGNANTP